MLYVPPAKFHFTLNFFNKLMLRDNEEEKASVNDYD
jgi:hypothetical protein